MLIGLGYLPFLIFSFWQAKPRPPDKPGSLALVPYARPLHVGDFDQHKHCREEEEEEEEEEGEGEGKVPPPRALSFCEWCSVLQILLSFWTCISASGPNERKVSLLSLILVNMQLPMASASGDYSYSHDYSYDDGRAFGAGGGSKRVGGGKRRPLFSRVVAGGGPREVRRFNHHHHQQDATHRRRHVSFGGGRRSKGRARWCGWWCRCHGRERYRRRGLGERRGGVGGGAGGATGSRRRLVICRGSSAGKLGRGKKRCVSEFVGWLVASACDSPYHQAFPFYDKTRIFTRRCFFFFSFLFLSLSLSLLLFRTQQARRPSSRWARAATTCGRRAPCS